MRHCGFEERSSTKVCRILSLDVSRSSCIKFSLFSRQVQATEGEKLGQRNGTAWIETSAKNNINVGQCNIYLPKCYRRYIISPQAKCLSYVLGRLRGEQRLTRLSPRLVDVSSCRSLWLDCGCLFYMVLAAPSIPQQLFPLKYLFFSFHVYAAFLLLHWDSANCPVHLDSLHFSLNDSPSLPTMLNLQFERSASQMPLLSLGRSRARFVRVSKTHHHQAKPQSTVDVNYVTKHVYFIHY